MVSQQELLRQQQSQQRTLQRQRSLQLQQQARRTGKSTSQIRAEREIEEKKKKREKLKSEVESFKENISFQNYEKKYKQLSPEARKLVKSPTEFKQSSAYQQFKRQQEARNRQKQYETALKVYTGKISGSFIKDIPQDVRKRAKEQAEEIERGEKLQDVIAIKRAAEKAGGFEPVYSGGGLAGFRDVEAGMSIPIQNIPQYERPAVTPRFKQPSAKQQFLMDIGATSKVDVQQVSPDFQSLVDTTQISKDLSIQRKSLVTEQKNGIIAGISRGVDNRMGSGDIDEKSFSGFGVNLVSGSLEGVQASKDESFVSAFGTGETGAFLSTSPTGASSTAFIRPPTQKELKVLRPPLNQQNILTIDINQLAFEQKKFSGITKEINRLSSEKQKKYDKLEDIGAKIIKQDQSYLVEPPKDEKRVNQYNKLISDIQSIEKKEQSQLAKLRRAGGGISAGGFIESPTIGVGIPGYTQQRPITEFGAVGEGKLIEGFSQTAIPTVGSTFGEIVRGTGFKGIDVKAKKEKTLPGFEISTPKPVFGTVQDTVGAFGTGAGGFTTKDLVISPEVKAGKAFTPTGLQTGIETGLGIGQYFVPYYGITLSGVRVAGGVAEADFNVVKYAKDNPFEAAMLGAIVAFKIGRATKRFVFKPDVKYEALTLEASKAKAPYGFITKPTFVESGGGLTTTVRTAKLVSQEVKAGRKVIVTTRIRRFLGLDPIYYGNPYVEREAYQKALRVLKRNGGYSEKTAREILRLRRPKFKEKVFTGEAVTRYGDEGFDTIVYGNIKVSDIQGAKFSDIALKGGEEIKVTAKGVPAGGKADVELTRISQKLYRDFRKPGKKTETFDILSGVKEADKSLQTLPVSSFDDIVFGKEFRVFEEAAISQRIIPRTFRRSGTRTRIFVEQGTPTFKLEFDEAVSGFGVTSSGKKSSEKFLKQLYGDEQSVAAVLSKTIPKTKPKAIPKFTKKAETSTGGLIAAERATTKLSKRLALGVTQRTEQVQRQTQEAQQIQRNLQRSVFVSGTGTVISPAIKQTPISSALTGQVVGQATAQKTLQTQQQDLMTLATFGGTTAPRITQPVATKTKPPKKPLFLFDEDKRKGLFPAKKQQAYNVFVKSKGEYRRITKKPVIRPQALDFGSNVVDSTLSADFKLKKAKGKPKPLDYKVPQGYWSQSFPKFRQFRQKKGKKIELKDRFIERSPYRLDTRREVNQINVAKYLKSIKKPKKVKKSVGIGLLTGFR